MKKLLVLVVAIVLTGLTFVPCVAAAPPIDAYGEWTWVHDFSADQLLKAAGGNYFFSCGEFATWTGTFTGTGYDSFIVVIHKDRFALGKLTINFAGSVAGKSGTMVAEFI